MGQASNRIGHGQLVGKIAKWLANWQVMTKRDGHSVARTKFDSIQDQKKRCMPSMTSPELLALEFTQPCFAASYTYLSV